MSNSKIMVFIAFMLLFATVQSTSVQSFEIGDAELQQLIGDVSSDEMGDLLQKRGDGCHCTTYLTARNSRHKGRLRKYCTCG